MMKTTNVSLNEKARSIVKPKKMKHGTTTADCGCALVSGAGNIYLGVSIDTSSGMGFCAEHSAIAAMITNGEYEIKTIVAVLEDGTILPPCGRCREFMHQIHEDNMNTDVLLGKQR